MKKLLFTALAFLVIISCGSSQNLAQLSSGQGNGSVNSPGGGSGGAKITGDTISFVTFGDWGTGDDEQKSVAAALKDYCGTEVCSFVVTLGDNILYDGVQSTTDGLWKERYTDIYAGLDIPFYAALGNHDGYGNVQAEIDYSQVDPTWHMPAEEYSFVMPEVGEPIVEFFVIRSEYPYFRDTAAQNWLRSAIDASQATWKILIMHHPLINNGNHGSDEQGNGEYLVPIICNKIDFIFSGHAHNFSYLKDDVDGCPIEQFVVGTGGQGLKPVDASDPRVVATKSMHGFGWVTMSASGAEFRMIATDGSVYYSTIWQKQP